MVRRLEKTVSVDPLSSRGINKFHLEGDFHLESDIEAIKVYQCLSKLSRSFESSKPYESNLNNISDMKNSEATKQPMLPDTSTCVADKGGLGRPWRSEDVFHSAPVNLTLIS